jgi:hypothetical protein
MSPTLAREEYSRVEALAKLFSDARVLALLEKRLENLRKVKQ